MRIISLLPSATEIVYALGLGDQLVGVTHECDYPLDARTKPVVTQSLIDHGDATSSEIDQAVTQQLHNNVGLYALDETLIAELRPDLILTQALCDVCAVSFDVVERVVQDVTTKFEGIAPKILSLEPSSLEDILLTIVGVGRATGTEEQAQHVVDGLRSRIERVREQAQQAPTHLRVACLEWIDPLFGPGHWLPEMIQLAGGEPGLGTAGTDARRISWSDIIAFAPEVIVVTPCGFNLDQTYQEAISILPYRAGWEALPAVRSKRVYAVDGNAYFSRPGPRIVDSLELLAELIHPSLFTGWGPKGAWAPLGVNAARSVSATIS